MKLGSGVVLVAVGLVILWLAVTGRLSNLAPAWATLNSDGTDASAGPASNPDASASAGAGTTQSALFPALRVSPDILKSFPVTPPIIAEA